MSDLLKPDANQIGRMYDQQAQQYREFADNSFSWNYIEAPAMTRYLSGIVTPHSHVLDIGTGTGRVVQLLTELGVPQSTITGIDVSEELLRGTRLLYPDSTLIHASADAFDLPPESFDVVTSNMVFQYLDNDMLTKAIENIYRVLRKNGKLCFVETHPLHSEEALKGKNNNEWIEQTTPWGEKIYIFNRDPYSLLDILELGGFNWVDGWETLKVSDQGRDDPNFERYAGRYSRAGYLWRKIDEETKRLRNDPNYTIPTLTGAD